MDYETNKLVLNKALLIEQNNRCFVRLGIFRNRLVIVSYRPTTLMEKIDLVFRGIILGFLMMFKFLEVCTEGPNEIKKKLLEGKRKEIDNAKFRREFCNALNLLDNVDIKILADLKDMSNFFDRYKEEWHRKNELIEKKVLLLKQQFGDKAISIKYVREEEKTDPQSVYLKEVKKVLSQMLCSYPEFPKQCASVDDVYALINDVEEHHAKILQLFYEVYVVPKIL